MPDARRALLTLGVASFFCQTGFHLYSASLPLYFSGLGFEPALIGLLVGAAGLAELPGALLVGPAIDRFGSKALLTFGAGCYVVASLGYLAIEAAPGLVVLRALQGLGIAAVFPSMYSFVPGLVRPRDQTRGFAGLGVAANLAMAVCPPLGLVLFQRAGPETLFLTAAAGASVGALLVTRVPSPTTARRPFAITFRRGWVPPVTVAILSVIQWGVIAAFLPLVASEAGANPALLFTADALALLTTRLFVGWFGDRVGPLRLAIVGMLCMTLGAWMLLAPMSNQVLLVAGALNGLGAGLVLPPMLVEITRRSDEASRGTGLAHFSVAFAFGMLMGSAFGGLLYPSLGFNGLIAIGGALCALGVVVLLRDRGFREDTRSPGAPLPPKRTRTLQEEQQAVELGP